MLRSINTHQIQERIREDLALAYQIFAYLKWDDLTYTHLSARVPNKDSFLIQPFGLLFEEITPDCLIEVGFDGQVIDQKDKQYNHTGYVIHGSIYQKRPELNAIFHLHTTDGVAVSALKEGLLPMSQFSLHFYNRISYHDYASLALDFHHQGSTVAHNLGTNKAMILRNHGTLTCGETIPEAFLYAYFLEKSCQVQMRALATGHDLVLPSAEICEQAAKDLRAFEPNFGERDWQAWKRKLSQKMIFT